VSGQVFLLLTAGAGRATAKPLAARVGAGVYGQALCRAGVPGGSPDLRRSALAAATEAARMLYRERHLDREIVVNYAIGEGDSEAFGNVVGRSAELAFAVALAAAVIECPLPAVAATGAVEDGAVCAVEGVAEKLAAALEVLPPGGIFAFPSANEQAVPDSLRQAAAARGIVAVAVHRLEELLARLGVPITKTWLREPFRGLEPFGFSHASIFFGREAETAAVVALMARRPAVLVRGPSGAGKSSLVLAGVMPALLRRDGCVRWGLLRPRDIAAYADEAGECEALGRALMSAWRHDEQGGLGTAAADDMPAATGLDAGAVAAWLKDSGARTPVLLIDQLEELFEARLQASTVEALARFLADLNGRGVALIATITNAALPELMKLPALAACIGVEGQYVLDAGPAPTLIEAVISAPAAAAGLRFETGLQAELIASASHGGTDVLPLLELLLTELYDRRDPATRELRLSDYRAAGGLDGVISIRAESVFDGLPPAQKELVPPLLWKLATAGAIETADFAADHEIHGLLKAYQDRRLLVRDRAVREGATLRPAHEALLRHWARAADQRRADAADIGLWLDLTREARQSQRGERALVPAGPQLDAARALLQRRRGFWTPSEAAVIDYVERSVRQLGRRRVLLGLAAGLPAATCAAWGGRTAWAWWQAQFETHIDFNDVSIQGKEDRIAAEPYLHGRGIAVTDRIPASSRIIIVRNLGVYSGRAARGLAGEYFLTQDVDDTTAPVSFTLSFDRPPRRVGLRRAELWAATGSGVTHPAWHAEALDADGRVLDTAGENLLRALPDRGQPHRLLMLDEQARAIGMETDFVPQRLHILGRDSARDIPALRITSDYRLGGMPFAGVHAVLINELILFYA
jgi:hypothetical protein